jgi:hypothetical protein
MQNVCLPTLSLHNSISRIAIAWCRGHQEMYDLLQMKKPGHTANSFRVCLCRGEKSSRGTSSTIASLALNVRLNRFEGQLANVCLRPDVVPVLCSQGSSSKESYPRWACDQGLFVQISRFRRKSSGQTYVSFKAPI